MVPSQGHGGPSHPVKRMVTVRPPKEEHVPLLEEDFTPLLTFDPNPTPVADDFWASKVKGSPFPTGRKMSTNEKRAMHLRHVSQKKYELFWGDDKRTLKMIPENSKQATTIFS